MTETTEVGRLNTRIVAMLTGKPDPWDVPVAELRLARDEGRSIFGELRTSARAEDDTLATSVGEISTRVFRPEGNPAGLYLHFHGGGWVLGDVHHQDSRLQRLADSTNQAVISVRYRLAPEHPYPAAPDDCEAAAVALIETAPSLFGVTALTMGGESAGAHLALVTALRLRDRHGYTGLAALNLLYGIYDLRLTPSARLYGSGPQILTTDSIKWFIDEFTPSGGRDDPDISPLLADVAGLAPAIFTVGTNDPLLDDTLFMAERWKAARNETELQVFADAPHAFDAFDLDIADQALGRINRFLTERVAG
ncbi:MAG: alpha/beta hydrolase [Acidimicrobiia bacterium]